MRKYLGWIAVILPFVLMSVLNLITWDRLGERVPMHWNLNGEVDSWGSRSTVWLLPLLFLWISFLLSISTLRLPEADQAAQKKSILWVQAGLGVLFLCLQSAVLSMAIQAKKILALGYLNMGFGIFMLSLGMGLKFCKRNPLIGIRLPWTIASEENWAATHKLASSLFTIAGIFVVFGAYFMSLRFSGGIFLAVLIVTVIHSYTLSRRSRAS